MPDLINMPALSPAAYQSAGYGVSPALGSAAPKPGETPKPGEEPTAAQKAKANGIEECQTCKNRRYQDGSDDPGVSFKSPTKIAPGTSAAAVMGHEREHYTREESKAKREGREVVSNTIRMFTDVCPECGKTYVSGGETRTATRKKEENAQFAKQEYDKRLKGSLPEVIDAKM